MNTELTTMAMATWLLLLTLGTAYNTFLLVSWKREVNAKLNAVDLKEDLLELRSLLTTEALRNNAELKRRAAAILDRLKADPLMHDKYWTEAQALEQLVK